MPRRIFPRAAFTLIEVLVVVAIIGVLIALLLPAINRIRESSMRTACTNNLRQIGVALNLTQESHGRLPPANGYYPFPLAQLNTPNSETARGTVMFHLLPYIDQKPLYAGSAVTQMSGTLFDMNQSSIYTHPISLFNCPSDASNMGKHLSDLASAPGWALASYTFNFQVFGKVRSNGTIVSNDLSAFNGEPRIPSTFADGVSKTILFAEKLGRCNDRNNRWANTDNNCWYAFGVSQYGDRPGKIGTTSRFQVQPLPYTGANCDPTVASTMHGMGMNALMGDASVRLLGSAMSGTTWWAACTPAGNDQLGPDW